MNGGGNTGSATATARGHSKGSQIVPVKYALYPGYIVSKTDGDRHFIGAARLADLYGVPMQECFVVRYGDVDPTRRRAPPGLIDLFPRYSGDYTLPPSP